MRLVTYRQRSGGGNHLGAVLESGEVLPLAGSSADRHAIPDDLVEFLAAGPAVRERAHERIQSLDGATMRREDIKLLAPVPVPNSIRDIPSFLDHIRNGFAAIGVANQPESIGKVPAYYKGNRRSVVGPDEDVVCPAYANELDFELEIGVVVCKQGKDITPEEAASYIGGYTIFNDVSARRRQSEEMQVGMGPAKGKDFDTGNVIGPWLVVDEPIDERSMTYSARVNEEVWAEGDTSSLTWTFAELISYCSISETLYPGDFIASGTVPGGCGLELGRFPKSGDVVELEVSSIGVLRSRFVAPIGIR